MWRLAILSLALATGCGGTSTAPQAVVPKEPVPIRNKAPSPQKKTEHNYQGWKKYAPTEAQFEVRFPKEPSTYPASADFHFVGIKRQATDDLEFSVQWRLKNQSYVNEGEEEAYLMGQQIGMLKASKGQLVEENEISLDEAQGREFIVKITDDYVSRCRCYLAGKRMIFLQVSGKDVAAVHSTDAVKFLDSLKIAN